jgi:thiol-disulfide isomerase/thioredoxin
MIRLFALMVTLFALTSFVHADEPKKPDVKLPAFAVEVQKIQKDVQEKLAPIYTAVEKEYEAAKTETDREAIMVKSTAESNKIHAPAYEQAMKLLRPNAADPAAIPGLVWVCNTRDNALQTEIVDLLKKHHLVRTETITFAKNNKQAGYEWVEGLLRAQFASADLPKDQAWRVHLALAMCLQSQAQLPSRILDATESESQLFDRVYGKLRVAEMKKYDPVKLEAEALKLFTEVGEKYPTQVIVPGLTVSDLAKSSIFEIKNLGVGKVAPDIEGEDLDGVKFKLSDYRGKTVMLSFWASWCGPCMGLIPHERELVEKYKERPFALIGVNGDPEKKDLKKVLETNKITWRSFWCGDKGPEGPIPMTWNVNSWPTVYVIDATGVIRSKNAHGKSLDARIEEWVKKTEAK